MNVKRVNLVIAGLCLFISSFANASLISFSFSDDPTDDVFGRTHVGGIVTGTLSFSEDINVDGTYLPDLIEFTSDLSWLGATDTLININGLVISGTGFTFTSGLVSDANLSFNYSDSAVGGLQFRLGSGSLNALFWNGGTGPVVVIGNRDGFGGATYGSVTVPEPLTIAMLALGMSGLVSRRFKKHS